MAHLTAIPTKEGMGILNEELKGQVGEYVLIGAPTYKEVELEKLIADTENAKFETIKNYVFYRDKCASVHYDENGILTFEVVLPIEADLQYYTFAVGLMAKNETLVCLTPTPKIVLIKGVGGSLIIKVAVRGVAGEIVFQSGNGVSRQELVVFREMTLKPIVEIAGAYVDLVTKLIKKGVL